MNEFHPDNLHKYLTEGFNCEKHPTEDLYIYGYHPLKYGKKNWDNTNINLRGIIVDGKGNIIARPFKKFFTFRQYLSEATILTTDQQIIQLSGSPTSIIEKVDGSMAILYWVNDKPYLATQRSFSSIKALLATNILNSFYFNTISKLNRQFTYIFEVISNETKVIIDHDFQNKLYLIGIIDTKSGIEQPLIDIGFELPHNYTAELKYVTNLKQLESLDLKNKEGFIINYENGLKIKIKFPWYREFHSQIDKLISLNQAQLLLIQQLKRKYNSTPLRLSNHFIFEQLSKSADLSSIIKRIPQFYYHFGFEEWLEKWLFFYLENQNSNISEIKKLVEEEYFSLNHNIGSDSVMWNFMNRVQSYFDS